MFVMPEKPISFDRCFMVGDNLKSLFYLHSKVRTELQLSVDKCKIIGLVLPFHNEKRVVFKQPFVVADDSVGIVSDLLQVVLMMIEKLYGGVITFPRKLGLPMVDRTHYLIG